MPTRYALEPVQMPQASFRDGLFARKLDELTAAGAFSREVLRGLGESFTLEDLRGSVTQALKQFQVRDLETENVARKVLMLGQATFEVQFTSDPGFSERVLFPFTLRQSHGIEDARFVLFQDDDGTRTYYATFTAYDGKEIQPQFLETPDFLRFKFATLNGPAIWNKGMALFPRKINGLYAMLGRQDYENIYVMFSDHLHIWRHKQFFWGQDSPGNSSRWAIADPRSKPNAAGWCSVTEWARCGNTASARSCLIVTTPLKSSAACAIRSSCPTKLNAKGYVPNVVYSCGSLLHGRQLIIPYGTADHATTFATVTLDEILDAME